MSAAGGGDGSATALVEGGASSGGFDMSKSSPIPDRFIQYVSCLSFIIRHAIWLNTLRICAGVRTSAVPSRCATWTSPPAGDAKVSTKSECIYLVFSYRL
ncbi:hypothetical protein EON64_10045 [archaeon]|nr:MAG: hypothetical protein EON64_10045 [archaeon]